MQKQTIKEVIEIRGIGLHTGDNVDMKILPAEANFGIKFRRSDIEGSDLIPAEVTYVVSTNRGTTIKRGNSEVNTVEHLLAAAYSLGIDNLLIELNGREVPILDGSAKPFVDAFLKAGIEEQDAAREYFVIEEPISFRDDATGAEIIGLPSDGFSVTSLIDFNSPVLGQQFAELRSLDEFAERIAKCRTFVFAHELEYLLDQNLIKGGSLDNAVVISNDELSQDHIDTIAQKMGMENLDINSQGILNKTELHFDNEPARHKLLDVIGDLALLGKGIKGKIVTKKSGHSVNVEFAKLLKKQFINQRKLKGKPKYDPTTDPLIDIEGIQKLLPHRHPFLLVDKIIEMTETKVVGIKNVTFDEAFFRGHFPNNAVFPGVLQMEALAQTGGILALNNVENPEDWDTYFLKMDNVKFKRKVVPGDTMILKMELMSPIRRGLVHMRGTTYVGNNIVSEGELTAQILKSR